MLLDDFPEFFKAVHGYDPFPWQVRLLHTVYEKGWPDTLALPTAAGKTSVMDISVFTLALQATSANRSAPLRTFFVIDRRLVVDEVTEHANKLAQSLATAQEKDGIVYEVAKRLKHLGTIPLAIALMRGGIIPDESWLRSPLQPAVIATTVDQVGSRLLFRGYGVSERTRSIYAGIVGSDSLFLIDEAHLSTPFIETLEAVKQHQKRFSVYNPAKQIQVVTMTATPTARSGSKLSLTNADENHPVLSKRLMASKKAKLVISKSEKDFEKCAVVEIFANLQPNEQVIGIVVNRVRSARSIYEQIHKQAKDDDVILLTGRIRPYDRNRILATLEDAKAGRDRNTPRKNRLFVVATQTIEVGANLDFDFLVTEAADLAALRQRFGRLDRLGQLGRTNAVIILREPQVLEVDQKKSKNDAITYKKTDPIYGEKLRETWNWLAKHSVTEEGLEYVDFGISCMNPILDDAPSPNVVHAPVLMPKHIDLWVQTNPAPHPDPDVAPFLHGRDKVSSADVELVWRQDLKIGEESLWPAIMAEFPPLLDEKLPLPVYAAKSWLQKSRSQPDVTDMEGIGIAGDRGEQHLPCIVYREGSPELIQGSDIRPGDLIIVPSEYGGADSFGWNPDSQEPVPDVANQISVQAAKREQGFRLRIHPDLMHTIYKDHDHPEDLFIEALNEAYNLEYFPYAEQTKYLVEKTIDSIENIYGIKLALPTEMEPYPIDAPKGFIFFGARPNKKTQSKSQELELHSKMVADHVVNLCIQIGFDSTLSSSLKDAAQLHDLGKAEPRFQIQLYGSNSDSHRTDMLLAKSGPSTYRKQHKAWMLSGLPKGFRHEHISARIINEHPELLNGSNPLLVYLLVGLHHGCGRSLVLPIDDSGASSFTFQWHGKPIEAHADHGLYKLDSGWTDAFWRLNNHYGAWGLAFLEALVRLSDWAVSKEADLE